MATGPAPPPPPRPNAYLTKPELYISGLTGEVKDGEIVQVLRDCLRLRLKLDRDPLEPTAPLTGVVEFESLDRAEKAYATCNRQRIGAHPGSLVLSLAPDPALDPRPLAPTLILKQLPKPFTPSELFDLVRPLGPVFSAVLIFGPSRDGIGPPLFKGQALVTYYEELHATEARNALHFLEVQGQNIAVQVYDPNRAAHKLKARVSGPSPRQHSSSESETPLTRSYDDLSRAPEPETSFPAGQAGLSLGLGSAPAAPGPSNTSLARPQSRKVSKWAPTPPEESSGASEREEGDESNRPAEMSVLESAMAKLATDSNRSAAPESSKHASAAITSAPVVPIQSERDRLAEGVAELLPDPDVRDQVLSLLLGLPKKERAKCLFNPDVLKLKVHDALAVLEGDDEETRESAPVDPQPALHNTTEITAPTLASEPTRLLPDNLVDLATWSCTDIVSILPALVQRFSLPVPPAAAVEESRAFMTALNGKPNGVVKQKLGERLFKVVKEVAKEQGLKGAPRITIELLDTEDLPALAELVLYPEILREKVISVGERISIG